MKKLDLFNETLQQTNDITFVKLSDLDRDMAAGYRDNSGRPLNEDEISKIYNEITRICADITVFIINDPSHYGRSTSYDCLDDKVYVTRNVLPDIVYGSSHPRDVMSIGAVLAHEYYGHRPHREEYLTDLRTGYRTIPIWKDECRASIEAFEKAPGLTDFDRRDLILDAVYRAREAGQVFELTYDMRKIIYGNFE